MNAIQDKPSSKASGEATSETAKRKDRRLKERHFASDRVGDMARYISFGVIGGIFFLFISDPGPAREFATDQRPILIASGFSSCVAILSDYFQYLFRYLSSQRAFSNEKGDYYYDTEWFEWKLVGITFWAKQIFVILSVILIIVAFVASVI